MKNDDICFLNLCVLLFCCVWVYSVSLVALL